MSIVMEFVVAFTDEIKGGWNAQKEKTHNQKA